MTPEDLQYFKDLLEKRLDDLVEGGSQKLEPNAGALERADEDTQPLGEMNQIIASERNKMRADEMGRIRGALRRLQNAPEDFGYCEECDDPIPRQRLELIPWSRYCVECQSQRDPTRGTSRKSLTDFR